MKHIKGVGTGFMLVGLVNIGSLLFLSAAEEVAHPAAGEVGTVGAAVGGAPTSTTSRFGRFTKGVGTKFGEARTAVGARFQTAKKEAEIAKKAFKSTAVGQRLFGAKPTPTTPETEPATAAVAGAQAPSKFERFRAAVGGAKTGMEQKFGVGAFSKETLMKQYIQSLLERLQNSNIQVPEPPEGLDLVELGIVAGPKRPGLGTRISTGFTGASESFKTGLQRVKSKLPSFGKEPSGTPRPAGYVSPTQRHTPPTRGLPPTPTGRTTSPES